MTAQTILPANSVSDTGFNVDNSLRVNAGDSAYLHKSQGSGNRRTFTISFWVKRSRQNDRQAIFSATVDGSNECFIWFDTTDELFVKENTSGSTNFEIRTNRKFRDPSAWYHIVVAYDTTNGTAGNRVRFYVNGVEETSFANETQPDENFQTKFNDGSTTLNIGRMNYDSEYFGGYLAEVVLIDGLQLAPTSFGEFGEDSGIWKPIDVSGLTFGTNGFYLDFEASGNLGNDANGGTDLTEVNLAATDQTTDTCTNNFATLNSLATGLDATLSEGNLKMVSGTATTRSGTASSIGFTAGKWFAEFKITVSANGIVGIAGTTQNKSATDDDDIGNYPGRTQQGYGYLSGGEVYNDSSAVTGSFATFTTDDIIGVALDLDGDLLYFYKNGAIQNSGTGIDISGITPHSGSWFFAVGDGSAGTASTVECNFGNPITALSSAVADGNGFGAFEFTPKSGHLALCTKNIGSNG
jgi:hypothetical protein